MTAVAWVRAHDAGLLAQVVGLLRTVFDPPAMRQSGTVVHRVAPDPCVPGLRVPGLRWFHVPY